MSKKSGSAFLLGTIIGAAAGAAVGMLYAPKKGEEIRKELSTKSSDLQKKARELIEKAHQVAEETSESIYQELRKAGSHLTVDEEPAPAQETSTEPKQSKSTTAKPAAPKTGLGKPRFFKNT